MRTTFKPEDVTVLLKDITGLVEPLPTKERERRIQSGTHYCEMLPIEYKPTPPYLEAYETALKAYAGETAAAAALAAEKIYREKKGAPVLVSLARAGTPVGVLIKRYLKRTYGIDAPHYTISIIRGRGIDHNAMRYLLKRHEPEQLQFVDGWIGKGAILNVLREALADYPGVSEQLAVLADPAHVTELCGTHEDILIPSSCLNSTVSGLMSRTFLRDDIIGSEDFHGAVYYGELKDQDMTYAFIDAIEREFDGGVSRQAAGTGFVREHDEAASPSSDRKADEAASLGFDRGLDETASQGAGTGMDEIRSVAAAFGITDINLIKPGIGETTRVLLRRVPWKVLIRQDCREDPVLRHIYRLAEEKQVEIVPWPLKNYRACGMIKKCSDI